MPLEQAFNLIDQALSQLNANRETHALLQASIERVKNEIMNLSQQVQTSKELYEKLTETMSLDSLSPDSLRNSDPS